MNAPIPDNLIQRPDGSYVELAKLPPRKQLAHNLVCQMFPRAVDQSQQLIILKRTMLAEMTAYCDLMAEEYETDVKGQSGGYSVTSVCGTMKVELSIAKHVSFSEELSAAKSLLDEFLADILGDLHGTDEDQQSVEIIRDIVQSAFKVNSKGRLSTDGILGLKKHQWDHPKWKRAMEAIEDATCRDSSTTYIRFYQIDPETKVETMVPLDLAKV